MYQNVLIPLDRSVESEGILDVVPELVNDDGHATLLTVIPPGRTKSLGELVVLGTQQEEEDRSPRPVLSKPDSQPSEAKLSRGNHGRGGQ